LQHNGRIKTGYLNPIQFKKISHKKQDRKSHIVDNKISLKNQTFEQDLEVSEAMSAMFGHFKLSWS
jgi:hypothetical protein